MPQWAQLLRSSGMWFKWKSRLIFVRVCPKADAVWQIFEMFCFLRPFTQSAKTWRHILVVTKSARKAGREWPLTKANWEFLLVLLGCCLIIFSERKAVLRPPTPLCLAKMRCHLWLITVSFHWARHSISRTCQQRNPHDHQSVGCENKMVFPANRYANIGQIPNNTSRR